MMHKEKSNALPLGTILHGVSYNYTIQKVLGQGTFGITYLAKVQMLGPLGCLDTNMSVAIKEFFMADICWRDGTNVMTGSKGGLFNEYKKKFSKEALNISKLSHPGIVKVLESFECNSSSYFSMDFIEGENLNDYILRQGSLSEKESLDCIVEIGEALSFMHANKMLHLDLKPMNIMRRTDGKLVLVDFGLSKHFNENGEPESSSSIGGGTTGYAPLEQSTFKKGDGFPATLDVYALGATLYKCLVGKTPPGASSLLNDGLPEELWSSGFNTDTIKLVEDAMHPLRKKRIQTINDFISKAKVIYPLSTKKNTTETQKINTNSKDDTWPAGQNRGQNIENVFGLQINWWFRNGESGFTKEGITKYLQSFKNLGNGIWGSSIPINKAMCASTHWEWNDYRNILYGNINFAMLQIKYLQQITGLTWRLPTGHELTYLILNGGNPKGKYFSYEPTSAKISIRDFGVFDGIQEFKCDHIDKLMQIRDCSCILVIDTSMKTKDDFEFSEFVRYYGIWQFGFCTVRDDWGRINDSYRVIDNSGREIISTHEHISDIGLQCIPGPGLPHDYFLGVECIEENYHVFYKIAPEMKLLEIARIEHDWYNQLCNFS